MTRAFVFPGQGAQVVGMGRDLAEAYPAARAVFDEVDAALGEKLSALVWEGDAGGADADAERAAGADGDLDRGDAGAGGGGGRGRVGGLRRRAFAGGIFGALRGGGDAARRHGADAAAARRRRCRRRCRSGVGAMAALLGLDLAAVEAVAAEAAQGEVCEAANDNDPAQVVVSGRQGGGGAGGGDRQGEGREAGACCCR